MLLVFTPKVMNNHEVILSWFLEKTRAPVTTVMGETLKYRQDSFRLISKHILPKLKQNTVSSKIKKIKIKQKLIPITDTYKL